MQATELLVEARERVASGWSQAEDARGAAGEAVEPWSADARAWSLLGAIVAAFEDGRMEEDGRVRLNELATALAALAQEIEDPSLATWNDHEHRTQNEVLGVLELAIAHLAV